MLRLFSITVALFNLAGLISAADKDSDAYYKKYNKLYHSSIQEEGDQLKAAKEKRDKDVLSVTKKYQKALEKILTMYTKEGKLDKALKVREEIKVLEKLVDAGKAEVVDAGKAEVNAPSLKKLEIEAKSVSASTVYKQELAANTVDGDEETSWAAPFPLQWIEIDLGRTFTIRQVRLLISQKPAGKTIHRVLGRTLLSDDMRILHVFDGNTADRQWLRTPAKLEWSKVRYLRIETTQSPSYVAWREIQVFE